ncbi:MAG: shikimate dehydrogenase [Spirochaetales bacterium]|nr:shikimate dehydrogenase [Candidatus Physcosoma equi]
MTWRRRPRPWGPKVIRSLHDFEGVPEDIFSKIHSMAARGDVAKVAVTPHSLMDVLTLFSINEELKDTPKIVIGMGNWGVCTRILYKKIGSLLTFGSNGEAVAPGQVSCKDLKELYRADQVNSATWIYGIVGNPVMHTASPSIHNPGFHKIKFNAIYVPFQAENIREFLMVAEYLRMRGFSVTVPFKIDIKSYLGNITREVKQIGSCNTVVRVPNMWKGSNTDYYGFLAPIEKDIEKGRIKNALVIGAGGAAQAIVWALKSRNIKVMILNRTLDKADKLAKQFGVQCDSLENQKNYEGWADIIVQTTSVGLAPHADANPLETFEFSGKEIAYDIIYKPRMTEFLKKAEKAGCSLRFGVDMLLEQGKLQFEAFTGYYYPQGLNPLI